MKIDELSPEIRAQAAHILDKLAGIELPEPAGWHVLCAQWITPTKVGSILMPEKRKEEDKFQGRAGLVLAVGRDCYTGSKFTAGAWCKVGDWIAWPMMENAASRIEYNGVVLTAIPDDRVVLVGVDPARVG